LFGFLAGQVSSLGQCPAPSDRGRIVWKICDLILEHTDELAQLEVLNNYTEVTSVVAQL
jgi:acyl-CoA reductase-like NAD-dependent aldehyde dehydrogenase